MNHLEGSPGAWISLIDRLPAMVAYVDRDRRFRFVNDAYAQAHASTSSALTGVPVREVSASLYRGIAPHIDAVLQGQPRSFEFPYLAPNGKRRWLQANYYPDRDQDGTVLGFFAFLQDMHSRRDSSTLHEQLRFACDQGNEGFALHDENGLFTYVNPAQANMYGYKTTELLGESWIRLYEPDEVRRIQQEHFPALMRDGHWRGELRGRRKGGESFDVEVSLTLLVDDHDQPSGLVCNCTDITDRKLAEASMQQLQKMDALGKLTGGIAHDFNNVLAVIVGNLNLVKLSMGEESPVAKHLDRALGAAEGGAKLTRRLLAFARKQPLAPDIVNVRELVLGMRELIERSLGERIRVEVDCADDLWPCHVDGSQLENAILNLAINARDALPDGGAVHIGLRNVFEHERVPAGLPPQNVSIVVRDDGTGMPEDVLQRVFDPFFTTKTADQGTGLGLSMVHGFVTQSDGRIEIDSELGCGTTVRILLPRYVGEDVEAGASPEIGDSVPGNSETVLVVEDRPDVLEATAGMLESLNYRVFTATDVETAKEQLSSTSIDLLLSDVILPGESSGPELVRFVKDAYPDLPVLLMSGYADVDIRTVGLEVVSKPFSLEQLARAVRTNLES